MIIVDTNVASELLRPSPEPRVEGWLAAQDGLDIYLTAISEAELRYGVAIMDNGIYIGRRFRNDTERLEKLFEMYTKMTKKVPA